MYCQNCGKKDIPDNYKFCTQCGAKIVGKQKESIEPPQPKTSIAADFTKYVAETQKAASFDPAVVEQFPAMMFSAVLDEATSDQCRELDGKIYLKSDPIWERITPPMHGECRCTIVDVDADELAEKGESEQPDLSLTTPEFGGTGKIVSFKISQQEQKELKAAIEGGKETMIKYIDKKNAERQEKYKEWEKSQRQNRPEGRDA